MKRQTQSVPDFLPSVPGPHPAARLRASSLAKEQVEVDDPTHPLIKDVQITFRRRLWTDWRGGLAASVITLVVVLHAPSHLIVEKRSVIVESAIAICSFVIMAQANRVEHFLSPPVEPKGIVSLSGKSVFFTVHVIFLLLAYYLISSTSLLLLLFDFESPSLTYVTYAFFPFIYTLGTLLSVLYYVGVLTDADEIANIRKWEKLRIPLSRYLHATHSSSIICVNIDLFFKGREMMCRHLFERPCDDVLRYALFYTSWVIFNFLFTGYFPYPFLNSFKNKYLPALLLGAIGFIGLGFAHGCWRMIGALKCGGGEESEGARLAGM